MTNKDIAKQIFDAVGGLENIKSVAHCATRLRVMVVDKSKVDQKTLEDVEKVKGVFFNTGQFQIILGTGLVNKIYAEFVDLGAPTSTKKEQNELVDSERPKDFKSWLKHLIRIFGDVFVPIIPILVATGLFMGLRGLINTIGYNVTGENVIIGNLALFTQIVTDTAFIFLPAFVVMSAFKVFGGNPMIGLTLGLMMVFPALPNAWAVAGGDPFLAFLDAVAGYNTAQQIADHLGGTLGSAFLHHYAELGSIELAKAAMSNYIALPEPITFFGFIPVVGFQASVIPAFVTGAVGAKLELFFRKRVADTFDLIVTPFLTMLIMIILALFVIGPIFRSVEDGIIAGFTAMLEWPLGFGGAIIGFFHQIIVVTGVHHSFNALEAALLATNNGFNPFNPIITAAMAGQIGAALAVGIKTKSTKLKALSFSSVSAGMLGITEPVLFGINLRYGKPFVFGLVAGAVGGALASILNLQANAMGITMIPGFLAYADRPWQLVGYIGVILTSMSIAGVLTYLFGFTDKQLEEVKAELEAA